MNIVTEVRIALGFATQASFATALGVTRGHISNLERKANADVGRTFVDKVCASFPQVNREYMLTGKGKPLRPETNPVQVTSFDRLSAAKELLLDIFEELSAEHKMEVLMLARVLLERGRAG